MVNRYVNQGTLQDIVGWVGLPRSSYYYKPHPGPRGKTASTYTLKHGIPVSNSLLIEDIKQAIADPYNAYGYDMVNDDLRLLGYLINRKKTYRTEIYFINGKMKKRRIPLIDGIEVDEFRLEATAAGGVNQELETVGAVHRAEDAGRQE